MCDLSRSPSGFPGVAMLDSLDIDPNFEPQTRARSNTWPLPRPENFIDPDQDEKPAVVPVHLHGQVGSDLPGQAPKKNSSRRNAWGNMSYADLITQAIHSSPDNRLTLAQIYEWMVQNVPYFKDKGDSNSSAGWKNSIRHNLSLHNRFMRVQNEGTGKSSWWMINPDAKPGKAARRRATSMETQKYEKKRGRVKKKVEALRNGQSAATPSPSSSISEGQDMFPESPPPVAHHGFQLSPDFRPRASSNASSCGRLSPIPAVETDMHDGEVPPVSPGWNAELMHMYDTQPPTGTTAVSSQTNTSNANPGLDRFTTDHLVESLAESMKLRNTSPGVDGYRLPDCALKPISNGRSTTSGYTISYKPFCNTSGGISRMGNGGSDFSRQQPPPYHQQHSPDANGSSLPPLATAVLQKRRSPPSHIIESGMNGSSYTLTRLQTISSAGGASSQPLSPTHALDPLFSNRLQTFDDVDTIMRPNQLPVYGAHKETKETVLGGGGSPLLQQQLQHNTASPPAYLHHLQHSNHHHHHHHQHNQSSSSSGTSLSSTANHVVGHLLYNSLPQDLDFDSLQGGLECDVDQVIRHELSVDGNLDFNFDPMNSAAVNSSNTNGSSVAHQVPMTSSRSWVH